MELFNKTYNNIAELVGRILIGSLFALAGANKILGFSGTAGWMASMGLPLAEVLLVLTIILELVGGVMLVLGIKVREVSFLLAGFVILATAIFHTSNLSEQTNMLLFTKNLMILGGLLIMSSKKPNSFVISKKLQ